MLDLGNNQIVDVTREDFSGVEDTLQVLSLADNYIITLSLETFQGFNKLDRLDLRGNSILNVLPLTTGTLNKLSYLNLADNALERIPFTSLAQIRSLSVINLANNRITSTFDVFFQGRLSIDSLILDNNLISSLPPFAFQNFNSINRWELMAASYIWITYFIIITNYLFLILFIQHIAEWKQYQRNRGRRI